MSGGSTPEVDHTSRNNKKQPCASPPLNHKAQSLLLGSMPSSPPPFLFSSLFLLPHTRFRPPILRVSTCRPLACMAPTNLYARTGLSKRIPYGRPLPSPVPAALTHSWPGIGDVGDSTMPTTVGNNGMLEYIWDIGCHQPAHSQSLRLGNQGISGDSRLYFALSG